tara:strand:+ start:234 stop:605 length:372 start_codon:yes stop_codon:yes gene_type:complete
MFIDISAILKIGKSIGTISKKSNTYPLKNLSNPFPTVPPKRYMIPIEFQYDLGGYLNIIVININEATKLMIVRNVVESLKRLKAAPLFFTRVKFNMFGIIIIDLSKPNANKTKNLLIWSIKII